MAEWKKTLLIHHQMIVFNTITMHRFIYICLYVMLLLLCASFNPFCVVEALQVIGGNVTVFNEETATLPCKLIDSSETLSRITWKRKTRKNKEVDNFFTILPSGPNFVNGFDLRFNFIGNYDNKDGSLHLSNITLLDEGTYWCIFTLFPSGNHQTEMTLNLLVPPAPILKVNPVLLGDEEVFLASCTAAGSKPPADVNFVTGSNKLEVTTKSIQHDNGTTTTTSWLFGVPTRDINQLSVKCVITSVSLGKEQILPFNLKVYFPPTEVTIIERSKNTFECLTEANPSANFTWSRPDLSWPESDVRVEGSTLHLLSISSKLNGLYQCEASNEYGRTRGQQSMHVDRVHTVVSITGWVSFGVVISVAIGFAAWWFFCRYKRYEGMQPVSTLELRLNSRSRSAE